MFIKWAIWGRNILFPDFKKINEKVNKKLRFKIDMTGWYGKLNYYFLFLWTLGELAFICAIIYVILQPR